MPSIPRVNTQLRSRVSRDGRLDLYFERSDLAPLADDEVLIEIEAAPINPSDMGSMFGITSLPAFTMYGSGFDRRITAQLPDAALPGLSGRFDQSHPTGLEGCGIVVEAGVSAKASALIGRRVATTGPGMFATFRVAHAKACLPLPEGVTATEGASAFVNPLTALGMVETAKAEGHRALVFTAAASNLGRMVHRLCDREGIGFVGVVRGGQHVEALRAEGVRHVCDMTSLEFAGQLTDAIAATGATLAYDAIAGGGIVNEILRCMEVVAVRQMASFSRYGSTTLKQLYLYGSLDPSPTVLRRNFGLSFGIGGWLLFHYLERISAEQRQALWERSAQGLKDIFVTKYAATLSLEAALDPEMIAAYMARGTGGKYLITPDASARRST